MIKVPSWQGHILVLLPANSLVHPLGSCVDSLIKCRTWDSHVDVPFVPFRCSTSQSQTRTFWVQALCVSKSRCISCIQVAGFYCFDRYHRHCYLALIQPMVDICHCYNLGLLNSQKSKACHRAEMLRLMQGTEVKMIGKAARLSVEAREVHIPHQWERQGVQQHEVCHTVICASTDHINMHKLSDRAR